LLVLFILISATPVAALQPSHDWQESIVQLRPGDHLHLSLKTGPVDGQFLSATPQDITVGSVTTPKEAVLKVQRYRLKADHPTRRRVRNAAIGVAIGFGAGYAIGATSTRCTTPNEWFCGGKFSNDLGLIFGGGGLVIGAAVGALLPERHPKETVYSLK
jgi:endonuclease YncB( thermonuclease family)